MKVIEKAKEDPEFTGISLFVMDDTAKSVTSSLSDLLNAGLLGALLSVIVLYLFLRQLTTLNRGAFGTILNLYYLRRDVSIRLYTQHLIVNGPHASGRYAGRQRRCDH